MKELQRLFNKKRKLVVGLMSGTSADGIDTVLMEVQGSGTTTRFRQIAFRTFPFPRGFSGDVLRNSDTATARIDELARLDMLIGELFADAVIRIARTARIRLQQIDLIGSHGQTVHHLPKPIRLHGKQIRATLQIGNTSVIAKRTGIVTVGNFRTGDVAVGGTGAPLVPIFDYLILRSPRKNRGVLNIGGIANITALPRGCTVTDVQAFDTGPGNMIIDGLMNHFFGRPFDRDGKKASNGRINPTLLRFLLDHEYLDRRPPKSTGRELFGREYWKLILQKSKGLHVDDVLATVTEFTAASIFQAYVRFIRPRMKIDELLISGGGIHNKYLMGSLRRYFGDVPVRTTAAVNISPDAKEAICFGLLANETIAGNPSNVPGATGASHQTILGSISLP